MKMAKGLGVVALVIAAVGLVWLLTRVPADAPIHVRQPNGLPRIQATADIDAAVFAVLERSGAPSASIAVVDEDGIRYSRAFGTRVGSRRDPANEATVFRAASLSKPVFAYLVMLLIADRRIGLDTPLQEYLPRPLSEYPGYADLAGDERTGKLTARLALTHQGGFPNWRWQQSDRRLRFLFSPGARFSYSGEGYGCLQLVLEQLTGKDLEDLSRERIFVPLGMRHTSWVWQDSFASNLAFDRQPIDEFFGPGFLARAIAAGSLLTTASDYARFLGAVLAGTGLSHDLRDEMLRPQIAISSEALFGGPPAEVKPAVEVAGLPTWALGWGGFAVGGIPARFHVGYEEQFDNYTVLYPSLPLGLVVLTSGQRPQAVCPELVRAILGETADPFGWMGY
jgi:CubicO group peptidase (beta-lactamase class C family)